MSGEQSKKTITIRCSKCSKDFEEAFIGLSQSINPRCPNCGNFPLVDATAYREFLAQLDELIRQAE